jgi:hypothetical protein
MTTLLCNHHLGIITYDQFGNQVVIGGQGQTTETARAAAVNAPASVAPAALVVQPASVTQSSKDKNVKGDAAKPLAGTVASSTAVSTVSLTTSQLNMSAAVRQLINDGVLVVTG